MNKRNLTYIFCIISLSLSICQHRGRRQVFPHLHLCLALLLGSRTRHYDTRPLAAGSPPLLLRHYYYRFPIRGHGALATTAVAGVLVRSGVEFQNAALHFGSLAGGAPFRTALPCRRLAQNDDLILNKRRGASGFHCPRL